VNLHILIYDWVRIFGLPSSDVFLLDFEILFLVIQLDLVNLHILKLVFWKILECLTLSVIPNKSSCRFMQNFCEREGSCGGLILVEYLLCIFLVSFWFWCTYAVANVISFGCLFSSCPSSCCMMYLCCLLAGYVLSLLFFLSFIFWKITTVKIF